MSKQRYIRPDPATYAAWLKMKRHDPRAWLKHEMDMIDPVLAKAKLLEKFHSTAFATELVWSIGALGVIAGVHGDKKGADACSDALIVLANAYCTLEY